MLPPISFVGGGNMATAMIAGLSRLDMRPELIVAEPDPAKRATFTAQGVVATADNTQAVAAGRIIVLAVKPQSAAAALPEIAAAWDSSKLLVSILAGTPTAKLEAVLPDGARVVRAMPNTPLAIGQGMVGICPGKHAGSHELGLVQALFAPCAKVLQVADESRMDAITAVSGSGPAYFFRFAEALLDAAIALGFTRDEAIVLIGQTGAGSWEYLQRSGFDAARLRQQVTSPGGTTAAALKVIDESGFTEVFIRALAAAEARGRELAKG